MLSMSSVHAPSSCQYDQQRQAVRPEHAKVRIKHAEMMRGVQNVAAKSAIQEDADAVGLSILSGAHMTLVPRVVELLREEGVDDVVVTVGGTIPADDIDELKRLGIAEVFTPGATTQEIVDFIQGAVTA